jgi:phosphate transport system substrate-binding protein
VITNPTNSFAECLSLTELSTLYGPAATNAITNWSQVNATWEAVTFALYAPPSDSTVVNLLDELLPGDGLRSDSAAQEDAAAVVSAVADDVAGLGFAPLSAVNASEAELQKISLDDLSGNGCVEPTQEAIEASQYPGARGLYLYVNAESLARESGSGLIAGVLGEPGKTAVADNGFLAPSDSLAAQVADHVANGVTGRAFSVGEPLHTIALDISGTVTAENSASALACWKISRPVSPSATPA